MASISKNFCENEYELVEFFKDILQAVEIPMKYDLCFHHYQLTFINTKTCFHSYSVMEQLQFFHKFKRVFHIDSQGCVSLLEIAIINTFVSVIHTSGIIHHIRLIKSIETMYNYFHGMANSDKFKFFRERVNTFLIDNDGYVSLSPQNNNINAFLKNGPTLKNAAKKLLNNHGPMHFTWFIERFKKLDSNLSYLELYTFFKQQSKNFRISMDGFVNSLSQSKNSYSQSKKLSSQISNKVKEDQVISFFVAKLVRYGFILYTVLLKFLQDSTSDIKNFFACYTLQGIRDFFVQNSTIFILMSSDYVTLRNVTTIPNLEFILIGEHRITTEDQQTIIDCFIKHLAMKKTLNHIEIFNKLLTEDSFNDTPLKKIISSFSSPQKLNFLKQYPNLFTIQNGLITLPSPNNINEISKRVIYYFLIHLKFQSTMNFWTLIKTLETTTIMKAYFKNFSPFDKFYFFKMFPNIFKINDDGLVTINETDIFKNELEFVKEVTIIVAVIIALRIHGAMHFEELYSKVSTFIKTSEVFNICSVSKNYEFFKRWPEYFHLESKNHISLTNVFKTSSSLIQKKKKKKKKISKTANSVHRMELDDNAIKTDLNINLATGSYSENNPIKMATPISTASYQFAKDLSEDNNSENSASSQILQYKYSVEDSPVTRGIILILINLLSSLTTEHFSTLCFFGAKTSESFKRFFTPCSDADKKEFFLHYSQYFDVKENGYVSLRSEELKDFTMHDIAQHMDNAKHLKNANLNASNKVFTVFETLDSKSDFCSDNKSTVKTKAKKRRKKKKTNSTQNMDIN